MPTLYQRVLGDDFDRLPDALREFHSRREGGSASGTIDVARGKGKLRHRIARLLDLPEAGTALALRLHIVPQGDGELWIRDFGGHKLVTSQWQAGRYLVEQAGPMSFVFELDVDEQGLRFRQVAGRVRNVPVPSNMSVHINALARGNNKGWQIDVSIAAPLLGAVTTYRGEVVPAPC